MPKCIYCGYLLRHLYGLSEYRCDQCGAEYTTVIVPKPESQPDYFAIAAALAFQHRAKLHRRKVDDGTEDTHRKKLVRSLPGT